MSEYDFRNSLGLAQSMPPEFFSSFDQIVEHSKQQPYSHLMRRAWESLELAGIFCIGKRPVIYFKRIDQTTAVDTSEIHRRFWNQGVAPLLIIESPAEIRVLSGLTCPERPDDPRRQLSGVVEVLNKTSDALIIARLIQRVETGQYYFDNRDHFDFDRSVDQYLLSNLRATRDLMVAGNSNLRLADAHTLLGRIIFTCYLIERKIIGRQAFEDIGADSCDSLQSLFNGFPSRNVRDKLFHLFENLRSYFDGSIFEETQIDHSIVNDSDIMILQQFLNGEELDTGQLSLGFWVYDFSIIPIETISAIYEDFLSAEGESSQRRTGAYYTPKHLAEYVLDAAVEGWDSLLDKRFLDPACGSGVFLVIVFNRIAEEWRYRHPEASDTERASALIDILTNQVCGVDINHTACLISSLSLYLALLDHLDPRDIHDLQTRQGYVLPPLLAESSSSGDNGDLSHTIVHRDFFDLPVSYGNFDLVIGNPPWVSRRDAINQSAHDWIEKRFSELDEVSVPRQQMDHTFAPLGQVAHLFMWKAPEHVKQSGRICFLLPTSVLLKRTDKFQWAWFQSFHVEEVIQLSDLRKLMFTRSKTPASIIRYRNSPPNGGDQRIRFLVPKASRLDPRRGIVELQAHDEKWVRWSELVSASKAGQSAFVWKSRTWGTGRDRKLVQRLAYEPPLGKLVGTPLQGKRWSGSQGFQPFIRESYDRNPSDYGEPAKSWWPSEHLYLNARINFDIVLLASQCEQVGRHFPQLHRTRDRRIYSPPMILANKGFTKVAFCKFPVLFQDSIYSIVGPEEDQELLAFAAAIIGSDVARYFLFHTSTSWGVERDQIHPNEFKSIPFPLPENTSSPSRSRRIVSEIAAHTLDAEVMLEDSLLGWDELKSGVRQQLNSRILDYFGLSKDERSLISDTIEYSIPSIAPSSFDSRVPYWRAADQRHLSLYTSTLVDTLRSWTMESGYYIDGTFHVSSSADINIVVVTRSKSKTSSPTRTDEVGFEDALTRLAVLLRSRGSHLSFRKSMRIFERDRISIVKPATIRNWTSTAALSDADELISSILSSGGVE